jgi:hypothetical protein
VFNKFLGKFEFPNKIQTVFKFELILEKQKSEKKKEEEKKGETLLSP